MVVNGTDLANKLRERAGCSGIDVIGFAEASEFQDYILKRSQRRDPTLRLSGAKTIVVAGVYIGGLVLASWDQPSIGRTSRLFLSGFFNDVVTPLEPVADLLRQEGYAALVCNDAKSEGSILPLKLAAIRAGLGWQGKSSLLVNRTFGTFLALGGILTDADLTPVLEQESDHCKGCTKCQQACPMGALAQPYVLNKSRCLSYQLQKGNLSQEARAVMGNRVMDCETCQQVCPWNTKHLNHPLQTSLVVSFRKTIPKWEEFFALERLRKLTSQDYRATVGRLGTGIPFAIFRRNVMAASERLRSRWWVEAPHG
jgi:epoxyqueuosine reductase QueG